MKNTKNCNYPFTSELHKAPKMETRPRIKIKHSRGDQSVELIGWLLLLCTWCFIMLVYPGLPATVPTHFNASGRADAYGSKSTLYLLPVISTLIFAGMTVLNKYPHIYNYPSVVTTENAYRLYSIATRVIRYLKTIVVAIFSSLTFQTYHIVKGGARELGTWFLPLSIFLLFLPSVYVIIMASSAGKRKRSQL